MNPAWQQYMSDQQMHLSPEGIALYQEGQKYFDHRKTALLSVDCLSIVTLRGEQAISGLQGQITQDARQLSEGKSLFTDICNPKGRIIASALMIPSKNDEIHLLVESRQAQVVCGHLNKYLMFHRVRLEPNTELVAIAEVNGQLIKDNHLTAIISPQLTLQLLPIQRARELWTQDDRVKGAENAWNALLLLHGICWVGASLTEAYTPHHLNHPGVHFVSFKKGCYTGQEIIARMEYKARLKTCFKLLETTAKVETDSLTAPQGEAAGKLIAACELAEQQWLYGAEIKADLLSALDCLYAGEEILRLIDPPYAITI